MPRKMTRTRRTTISRPSRKFIWARHFIAEPVVDLGAPTFDDALADVQTAIGADLIGSTLVRVRGNIIVQNATDIGGFTVVVGMRVFTTSTLGTLVAGNGPVQDEYADWLMWEPFNVTANGNEQYGAHRKEIDVRSSRKLEEVGQSLLLSIQGTSLNDAQVIGQLSFGVKLP